MALDSSSELSAFHEFVAGQLQNSGDLRTPEDCLEMWRNLHPHSEDLANSTAAIKQALADMEAGDSGRSARMLLSKAREKHGLGS